MRLTNEELKQITFGAVEVHEEGSSLRFSKCTEKQEAAWYAYSTVLGDRARTTTGIRLDFHTDSSYIEFRASKGGKFELLIDGILRKRLSGSETEIPTRVELTSVVGTRSESVRVTLIYPSHSLGILDYVELEDGATVTPHQYDRKLLFIGDSITQGHNSYFDSLSYAWRVTNYFNAESVINGIGGAFFATSTFDTSSYDPDAVIVAYGTNDWGRYPDFEQMKREVTGYFDLLRENYGDKKIIVISPIWRANGEGVVFGEKFDERRKFIESEARARGFYAIDGLTLLIPDPSFYSDRYLHPNDLGFSVYAENLIRQITPIL